MLANVKPLESFRSAKKADTGERKQEEDFGEDSDSMNSLFQADKGGEGFSELKTCELLDFETFIANIDQRNCEDDAQSSDSSCDEQEPRWKVKKLKKKRIANEPRYFEIQAHKATVSSSFRAQVKMTKRKTMELVGDEGPTP